MRDVVNQEFARDVAVAPGGKIVTVGLGRLQRVGNFTNGGPVRGPDFAVTRLHGDGSADRSFSDDGLALTNFNDANFAEGEDQANAVAVQPDGRIVVVGSVAQNPAAPTGQDFGLARYDVDGSPDTDFSDDGRALTDLGSSSEAALDVALQSDGKIVVAGYSGADIALARYHPDGTLDTGFGDDGLLISNLIIDLGPSSDAAASLAIQPDGRIVVGGSSDARVEGAGEFAVARYLPDGAIDTSFSDDGFQITPGAGAISDIALRPDGTIVAVGTVPEASIGRTVVQLVRYTSAGEHDPAFADAGVERAPLPGADGDVRGEALAIHANGKILVAGTATTTIPAVGQRDAFALIRYDADGALDSTFSDNGWLTTTFNPGAMERANAIAIQADGNPILAGQSLAGTSDVAIARYLGDARPDPGLPNTQITSAPPASTTATSAQVVFTSPSSGATFECRMDNGAYEPCTSPVGYDNLLPGTHTVAVRASTATGTDPTPDSTSWTIKKPPVVGDLDPGFGGDGKVRFQWPDRVRDVVNQEFARDVAVAPGGKIVTVGLSWLQRVADFTNGGPVRGPDFAVTRLHGDGSADRSFSDDGLALTNFNDANFAEGEDQANAVAVQPDGRIVVVGSVAQNPAASTGQDFGLARYDTDGSLDTDFSGDGRVISDLGSSSEAALDVALQSDGKIVVAGYSGADIALARYHPDGTLDTSFSDDGVLTVDLGLSSDAARALAIQPNGRIVVGGSSDARVEGVAEFAIARYLTDGSTDASFSGDGFQITPGAGANQRHRAANRWQHRRRRHGARGFDRANGCATRALHQRRRARPRLRRRRRPAHRAARRRRRRPRRSARHPRQRQDPRRRHRHHHDPRRRPARRVRADPLRHRRRAGQHVLRQRLADHDVQPRRDGTRERDRDPSRRQSHPRRPVTRRHQRRRDRPLPRRPAPRHDAARDADRLGALWNRDEQPRAHHVFERGGRDVRVPSRQHRRGRLRALHLAAGLLRPRRRRAHVRGPCRRRGGKPR